MNKSSTARRGLVAALSVLMLGSTIAPAFADRWDRRGRHGYERHHHHHHHHYRDRDRRRAAAAVGLGIAGVAVGAAIANSNRNRGCYVERQRFTDRYGDRRVRTVKVCR